jgi:hypothetical protein
MSARIHVREDLAAAHDRAWARLARAGTWWTGAERVAIAAEARRAEEILTYQQPNSSRACERPGSLQRLFRL